MIRYFDYERDTGAMNAIHEANGLPSNCLPDIGRVDSRNPLFLFAGVYSNGEKPAMMAFLKVTSEVFLLVDHTVGTPEERWQWLRELTEWVKQEAWDRGLDQITAFVPPEIEESFAKRLLDLGFVKSPWQSYTLNLEA